MFPLGDSQLSVLLAITIFKMDNTTNTFNQPSVSSFVDESVSVEDVIEVIVRETHVNTIKDMCDVSVVNDQVEDQALIFRLQLLRNSNLRSYERLIAVLKACFSGDYNFIARQKFFQKELVKYFIIFPREARAAYCAIALSDSRLDLEEYCFFVRNLLDEEPDVGDCSPPLRSFEFQSGLPQKFVDSDITGRRFWYNYGKYVGPIVPLGRARRRFLNSDVRWTRVPVRDFGSGKYLFDEGSLGLSVPLVRAPWYRGVGPLGYTFRLNRVLDQDKYVMPPEAYWAVKYNKSFDYQAFGNPFGGIKEEITSLKSFLVELVTNAFGQADTWSHNTSERLKDALLDGLVGVEIMTGDTTSKAKSIAERITHSVDGLVKSLDHATKLAEDKFVPIAQVGVGSVPATLQILIVVMISLTMLWWANKHGFLDSILGTLTTIVSIFGTAYFGSGLIGSCIDIIFEFWTGWNTSHTMEYQAFSGVVEGFGWFGLRKVILGSKFVPSIVKEYVFDLPKATLSGAVVKDLLESFLINVQDTYNSVMTRFGFDKIDLFRKEGDLVDEWISRVEGLSLEIASRPSGVSLGDSARVKTLLREYVDIRKVVKPNTPFFSVVSRKFAELLAIENSIAALASSSDRPEPAFVLIAGKPGCGKSTILHHLAPYMVCKIYEGKGVLSGVDDIPNHIYNVCYDKFWNGWDNQCVTVFDDIFQIPATTQMASGSESDAIKIVRAVNTVPYPLTSAVAEDKGKRYFTARLILGTTNTVSLLDELNRTVVSKGALGRRIHFGLHIRPYKKFCREGVNPDDDNALDIDKFNARFAEVGTAVFDEALQIEKWDFFSASAAGSSGVIPYSTLLELISNRIVYTEQVTNQLKSLVNDSLVDKFRFQGNVEIEPEEEFSDASTGLPSFMDRVKYRLGSYWGYLCESKEGWNKYMCSTWVSTALCVISLCVFVRSCIKPLFKKSTDEHNDLVSSFSRFVKEQGLDEGSFTFRDAKQFVNRVRGVVDYQATEFSRNQMHSITSNRLVIFKVTGNTRTLVSEMLVVKGSMALVNNHVCTTIGAWEKDSVAEFYDLGKSACVMSMTFEAFRQMLLKGELVPGSEMLLVDCLVKRQTILSYFFRESDLRSGTATGYSFLTHLKVGSGVEPRVVPMSTVRVELTPFVPPTREESAVECLGHVSYSVGAENGDCGSLVFLSESDFQQSRRILGFHFGRMANTNFACIVTQERLDRAFTKFAKTIEVPEPNLVKKFEYQYECALPCPTVDFLGRVSPKMFTSSDSRMVMTQYGMRQPLGICHKVPVSLKFLNGISPVERFLAKVGTPQRAFPVGKVRRAVWMAMSRHSDLSRDFPRRIYGYEEAVLFDVKTGMNAIPRSTSPGYPWCAHGHSDKSFLFGRSQEYEFNSHSWLQLVEQMTRIEGFLSRGQRPSGDDAFIFLDFVKDELLPEEKVAAGKARMISGAPITYTVLFRKYFGSFMQSIQRHRIYNGIAIGANPYDEWGAIASHLGRGRKKVVAGDYSGYDASEVPSIHIEILNYINNWYDDGPENSLIRRVLWEEVIHSLHLTGKGCIKDILAFWSKSLPSGHPATGIINSIYNLTLFALCYIDLVGDDGKFWDYVTPIVLGDDSVVAIDDAIVERFNQNSLSENMLVYGIVYTDESKSVGSVMPYRHLEDVSFLKRSFTLVGSRWVPRLDRNSIRFMGYYVHRVLDMPITVAQAVDAASREASLWDDEFFLNYTEQAKASLKAVGYPVPLSLNTDRKTLCEMVLSDSSFAPWSGSFCYF